MKAIPKAKRILVLYWHPGPGSLRLAISRHLHVLDWSTAKHHVLYFNAVNGVPGWLRRFKWDVVILHTTLLCLRWSHLFHTWKWHLRWLNDLSCLKAAFPQDEYDHAHILDEWLFELGVHLIFTNFDEKYRRTLYPLMCDRAIFRQCLTGYIDETDAGNIQGRLHEPDSRPVDIVYRATYLPFWFGSHGQLKHRIAEQVLAGAGTHGLRVNISTKNEDTIVGPAWLEFLASGRTVIGSESGSSVLDPRGAIKAKIQLMVAANPDLTFEETATFMPSDWDQYQFFAISPRHLEAVTTRTCQVLVEGTYDGVLHPHIHYLPLRRDFSNLDEILEMVRNHVLVRDIAHRAYQDICESGRYTYRRFAQEIEEAMQAAAGHQEVRTGGSFRTWSRMTWPATLRLARAAEVNRLTRYRIAMTVVTSPFYWCFLRHPLVCVAKAQLALQLILASPPLVKLLRLCWRNRITATLTFRHALMDGFMLRVLQQLQTGQVRGCTGIGIAVDLQPKQKALVFRSHVKNNGCNIEDDKEADAVRQNIGLENSFTRITWDHSAVGRELLFPVFRSKRLSLPIGLCGVYEFKTLPVLCARYPKETLRALFQA